MFLADIEKKELKCLNRKYFQCHSDHYRNCLVPTQRVDPECGTSSQPNHIHSVQTDICKMLWDTESNLHYRNIEPMPEPSWME